MPSSRRRFIKNSAAIIPSVALLSENSTTKESAASKLKIVCVGGHPDDPESGCGGTLAKLAAVGHEVTIIYLTRGEAGINGKSHKEAADIRSKEAEAACAILKAKPVFAGQIDGDTIVNNDWIGTILKMIVSIMPDIVFTHWPIDSHKDHQAASLLTIQSWMRIAKKFDLYFFEVCGGDQTMTFKPTDYVDISSTQEQKRKAIYCHVSQDPPGFYEGDDCNHGLMEKFRGMEINVKYAEGFVRMAGSGTGDTLRF